MRARGTIFLAAVLALEVEYALALRKTDAISDPFPSDSATCYFQSKFIGDFSETSFTAKFITGVSAATFERNLTGYGVYWNEVHSNGNITLDMVFRSNVTAMIGAFYTVPERCRESEIKDAYSGATYNQYSLDAEKEYYNFFKNGKYKYHGDENPEVHTAFLTCVFPETWVNTTAHALNENNAKLKVTVETTDFEMYAWNSVTYKLWFQFCAGFAFLFLFLECIYGIQQYFKLCSWAEIYEVFGSPVACLVVNMATSAVMSFVFFIDGWGSTGFLTLETYTAFITLTRMTTMGSVLMMSLHWMKLRAKISSAAVRKGSTNNNYFDSQRPSSWVPDHGGDKRQNEVKKNFFQQKVLKHRNLLLYLVAFVCLFTDSFSFLYVKIFRKVMMDIWIPLLACCAVLEFAAAMFFTQESNLFAKMISKIVNEKNLASASNLRYLDRMLKYMRYCSFFLVVSAAVSVAFGISPYRNNVWMYCILWSLAIATRFAIAHAIVRASFLNTNPRRRRSIKPASNAYSPSSPLG